MNLERKQEILEQNYTNKLKIFIIQKNILDQKN